MQTTNSLPPLATTASPVVVHLHFHKRRTGVTTSLQQILPFLSQHTEVYVLGSAVRWPSLSCTHFLRLAFGSRSLVVHAHRNNELLFAWVLRFLGARFRLVATRHSATVPSRWTRFLFSRAEVIFRLTPEVSDTFPLPTTYVPHGVDPAQWPEGLCQSNDSLWGRHKEILMMGRIRPAKGQDTFVEAVCRVLPQFPDWKATIIGRVDDLSFAHGLKTRIEHAGLTERVQWIEETEQIGDRLRSAGIVVIPSRSEGFSMVCLEAMVSGCTVVATRAVGIHSAVITSPLLGYLFPIDDAEECSERLRFIASGSLLDPQVVRKHIVSQWFAEKTAKGLLKAYGF